MKFRRLGAMGSALILSISSLLTIGLATTMGTAFAAAPYTCTWTGAGGNNNFSTAGNWSGCNSAAPVATDADNLVFDSTNLTVSTTINNDISGLIVGNLTFQGTNSNYYQYTITGSSTNITINNGITVSSGNNPTIATTLNAGANLAISGTAGGALLLGNTSTSGTLNMGTYTLTVGSGSSYFYLFANNGVFSGSGSIVVQADATLSVFNSSPSWTGAISTVGNGVIDDNNVTGLGSASSVTISNNGAICFGGFNGANFSPNLNVGGSTSNDPIFTAPRCGSGGGGGTSTSNPAASVNLTGSVTLTANALVFSSGTTTISGPLSGNYTLGLDNSSYGSLVINSSNNTSLSPNGKNTVPTQVTVASGDNQPNLQVSINSGQTYTIDGVRGITYVNPGGTLKGTGTVGDLTVSGPFSTTGAGIVSPGDAPGCLTVNGTLNEAGIYQAEIGGTTPCSGYDQLDVTGTITLNDGGTPPNPGTLQVSLINGFKPTAGQVFNIIKNEGTSPVSGTFSGLPEGSEITVSGYVFKISYVGAGSNSVTLTVVSIPKTPNTGSALTSAKFELPLIGTILIASGLFFGYKRILITTINKK